MKATRTLHDLGQSLWLDNITRELLHSGALQRHIDEFSVTGLTSNPTIFDHAIKSSTTYDADISRKALSTRSAEDVFFQLALADLTRAAELFHPVFARTDEVDGWVSLEVSPLLAHDTASTLALRAVSTGAAASPTSLSRLPALRRDCPPSKRRSSPAFRSMSRCCSHGSSISRRPKPICAGSSGASRRG